MSWIIQGDNLQILKRIKSNCIDLIYVDPPFNTGHIQKRGRLDKEQAKLQYEDSFKNFEKFLKLRIEQARRILKDSGSFFLHLDYREIHYAKIWCDEVFGRDNFRNQIIWAYDYGARSKSKWSSKHDVILWYTASNRFTFNYDVIDRIPYLAPGLCGKEKAKIGKTPTDVWWNTIVSPMGKEKTGYPTQKPLSILSRIVKVHSNENDRCMDFFAGSGSFGEACLLHKRNVYLMDKNPQAIQVMKTRLDKYKIEVKNLR